MLGLDEQARPNNDESYGQMDGWWDRQMVEGQMGMICSSSKLPIPYQLQ